MASPDPCQKAVGANSQTGRTHIAAPLARSLIKKQPPPDKKNFKTGFSSCFVSFFFFHVFCYKNTEAFPLITSELFTCQPVGSCVHNNDGTQAVGSAQNVLVAGKAGLLLC